MTFSSALSNAISGMNAATTAIQVRGHNVANAMTPGYARRDVMLTARSPSGGVLVETIQRAEAGRLGGLRLAADATSAGAMAKSDAAGELSRLLGEPGDEAGLFARYSRLETALADLAATPESAAYQSAALDAANGLTAAFRRIGDAAQAMRGDADAGIAAGVDAVNRALLGLEEMNERVTSEGNALSDMPEQRQRLINTIGEHLSIRVQTNARGQVRIATAEGVPLLGDEARLLSFRPAGVVAAGQTMATGHLSGLSAGGIDITPGEGVQASAAGKIAGLFAVRDATVPAFSSRLDALAENLVSRFASDAFDPTKAPGADGLFTGTPGPGAASRIGVNAAVDPERGGALWRLRDGLSATVPGPAGASGILPALNAALSEPAAVPDATGSPSAYSASDAVAAFSSSLGTERLAADARAAAVGASADELRQQALSATGVNTDQELQSLLLIEQAYAANARVVQVVSDMMARLLEI
ncbi:flagellar hook-associated protein FlgK [Parvularcula oceani]|uniref:flagellar hook-associated protein FlgK n=1 Tax=Parvularcula oceani TaxID=1247963 RepID=UPI00068C8214|nr:flagellar hook-associated protein FlgK [Parvularcula oceani]